MNRRELKKALRLILAHHVRGFADCHNARVEAQLVFFCRRHGLDVPPPFAGTLWARICSLLYDRRCEACRTAIIERSVYNVWNGQVEGCACA